MGWFNEQIQDRIKKDQQMLSDSFADLAYNITGDKAYAYFSSSSGSSINAIRDLMNYFHLRLSDIPSKITDINEQLEYLLRPNGIMRRTVRLSSGWSSCAAGAMIGKLKDRDEYVAILPHGIQSYAYYDTKLKRQVRITSETEKDFESTAISFYRPFPLRKMTGRDLFRFILSTLDAADVVTLAVLTLAVTLFGLLIPRLNDIFLNQVVRLGSVSLLLTITVFFICATVSQKLFTDLRGTILAKMTSKMTVSCEAAAMMRIFSLPASFFKNYSSGDLAKRVEYMETLCNVLVNSLVSVGLTSVFSIAYFSQISAYTPTLVLPAALVLAAIIAVAVISMLLQIKATDERLEAEARENGTAYSLMSGIQKVRLAGAEKRAFSKWAEAYAREARYEYNPSFAIKITPVITNAISLIGVIVFYLIAIRDSISASDYYVFNSSFALVSAAVASLASIISAVAEIRPIVTSLKPILETEPEVAENKTVIDHLTGGVELNNVSFRYNPSMPNVIDNLSLKIRPGQYVGIVGRTGCGKSTLMRLLLGFETPQRGAIYYDGKDIATIDLKSLRRKIGVVMQEGRLFQGDILSNITVSAPWLTEEDAWKAAELAGIADDIRSMPNGMYTLITEGSGGISGGQRQRLMIARAIAAKPRLLIFDEATSALDNISQKIVSRSLSQLKCTRIVIAHRLTTIEDCDRIIVLDDGKIVEDGSYSELLARGGFFTELVKRQQV